MAILLSVGTQAEIWHFGEIEIKVVFLNTNDCDEIAIRDAIPNGNE